MIASAIPLLSCKIKEETLREAYYLSTTKKIVVQLIN
jgi:hypothetical protein